MELKNLAELLSHSVVFRGINTSEIEDLLGNIRYVVKSYQKSNNIVLRDDPCNDLKIVIEGNVRGEMLDFTGKTIKIEDIEAPRPLAIAFLFGNSAVYPVDIISNTDSKILSIPKKDVLYLMSNNQFFLTNFLNNVSSRAQFLSKKLYFLSFKTIREKISNFLKEESAKQGKIITLRVTQESLANMFGVTRPSLARTMGELVKQGAIRVNRKEIEIIDKSKLF